MKKMIGAFLLTRDELCIIRELKAKYQFSDAFNEIVKQLKVKEAWLNEFRTYVASISMYDRGEWYEEDVLFFVNAWNEGKTVVDIAKHLKRTPSAIKSHAGKLRAMGFRLKERSRMCAKGQVAIVAVPRDVEILSTNDRIRVNRWAESLDAVTAKRVGVGDAYKWNGMDWKRRLTIYHKWHKNPKVRGVDTTSQLDDDVDVIRPVSPEPTLTILKQ